MQEVEQHEIQNLVNAVHARYLEDHSGEVATYIPELGKADPRHFGICLATVDGQVFDAGDTSQLFTIQSISKAFVFAMAIEEHGLEEVLRHVGVEPSGDGFNSIVLDEVTVRPFNPMVNAGAIATTALIGGSTPEARFQNLRHTFSRAAGRELERDDAVFESERLTGHRNRAIAHLMLNFGMIPDRVDEILDLYFSQCSLLVNAHDLALMGATLANLGTNPVTGEHVFDVASVKYVLAVMLTCGMYDFSGEWAFRVGVPAKSGVAGGVLAVVNRQLGLGLYSPRLDSRGNSVRGFKACIEIADDLGLHAFDFLNVGSAFLQGMIKPD